MKCLTICQPYAELIIRGMKWVENRTWPTLYRGPLLIHAGKSRGWLPTDDTGSRIAPIDPESGVAVADMAFGAIVGIASLEMCITSERIHRNADETEHPELRAHWKVLSNHKHTEGPWCWVLRDVKRFVEPIPYRGAQGLFDVPAEVVAAQIALSPAAPAQPSDAKEKQS